MSARILFASVAAVTLALLSTACNNTKTVNRTIPPIAGVTVGGPSDTNGNGQVGVAVNEAEATVAPNTTITVRNLTRSVENSANSGTGTVMAVISVPGDVGDMLKVTLDVIGFGMVTAEPYDVPSVAITNVSSGAGDLTVIPGQHATIVGSGFCIVDGQLTTNRIFIDGTALEPSALVHAGAHEMNFNAPMLLSTNGTHSLQVTVGNTAPGNPTYSSNTLTFVATHPL